MCAFFFGGGGGGGAKHWPQSMDHVSFPWFDAHVSRSFSPLVGNKNYGDTFSHQKSWQFSADSVSVLSQNGVHTWNTLASVVTIRCRVVWLRLSGALALASALISHMQMLHSHLQRCLSPQLLAELSSSSSLTSSPFSLEFLFMDLVGKQKYGQWKPCPASVI